MDEEEHRKEFLRWCENKRIRDAIRSGSDLSSYRSDSEQLVDDFDLLEFVDRIEWVADRFSRKQIFGLTRADIQAHDDEVREALALVLEVIRQSGTNKLTKVVKSLRLEIQRTAKAAANAQYR
jgi:hypothetical protein